jgi:predicted transposase/invertase (TIGR01784 family)
MEVDNLVDGSSDLLERRESVMTSLLTPKLDIVFKLLFTRDTDILLDLVNCVLAYPEQVHIHELDVKNPTVLPEELTEKFIILDILAIDEARRQYDIEMQVQRYSVYPERALYYLCRLYGNQLNSGGRVMGD